MPSQQTPQQIESQIKALEFRLKYCIDNHAKQSTIFALNGKIKQLRNKLSEIRKFEFLAK